MEKNEVTNTFEQAIALHPISTLSNKEIKDQVIKDLKNFYHLGVLATVMSFQKDVQEGRDPMEEVFKALSRFNTDKEVDQLFQKATEYGKS